MGMVLEVFRDGLEGVDDLALLARQRACDLVEAVVEMILDQRLLGLPDRTLDRLQLLGDVEAGAPGFDHLDDLAQMTVSPLQPLDDGRVSFVKVRLRHDFPYPPG